VDLLNFDAHAHNPKRIYPESHPGVNTERRGKTSEERDV
jgi:hypothetical protein